MAALGIKWETLESLIKPGAVATGDTEEGEEAPSPFASLDKPVIVFVADTTVAMSDFEKIEEVVFKAEKISLAMKAFRAIRMSPEAADRDPLISGKGKNVPRILVVDPLKEKVKVLEKGRIKVSSLYSEMKKVANRFYKERLEKVVKTHLKLLTERDQLVNKAKVLRDKEGRLASGDGGAAAKKLKKVRGEIREVEDELEGLATTERDLWKLTPKHKAT